MSDTVAETVNLVKDYGGGHGISDVSLSVRKSEIFGFLGPNGAGKTTTIRILLDFIRRTSGEARLFVTRWVLASWEFPSSKTGSFL